MDILSSLFNIVSNSVPSGVIMITGAILIFISFGGGGAKVQGSLKESTRRKIFWIGVTFLIVGFVLTFIISILQIWSSYSSILNSVSNFVISFVSSPRFWITVVLVVLLIVGSRRVLIWWIERSYKIIAFGTVNFDRRRGDKEVYIQVVNTGKRKFPCIAMPVSIIKKPLDGKTKEQIIHDINPKGNYLGWGGMESIIKNSTLEFLRLLL